jgi:Uma2 family endonuclease
MLDGYVIYKGDFVDLPEGGPFPEWRLLRRWTVEEYRRMINSGIIRGDERLELLDGYLVIVMPQNTPHRAAVNRLPYSLPAALPPGWAVMTHCPVSAGLMQPEPDGVVVRGKRTDYDSRDPDSGDFGIIIEVSDSTLDLDRRAKGRLYARSGIPVYWIVNLVDGQVEVYTDPDPAANPPAYRTRADYRAGDAVPITLDGQPAGTIPAGELLP